MTVAFCFRHRCSKEQVSIVVAYDRNGNIICQMGGRGRIKAEEIDEVIGGYITFFFALYRQRDEL